MHSLTNKTLSLLLFFFNELPLIRTQEDNLTGLRTITKKTLHMLNGQRQVSMHKAVHMVDNQELVICSDMFTYVSLAQGQTRQYENDKSSSKDLITIYRNRDKKHYHYSLEQYFYSVLIQSTFKKRDDNANTQKTNINPDQHHILIPKGMNCKPQYPVGYNYEEACSLCTSHGIKI
jgi:hypothetical protein